MWLINTQTLSLEYFVNHETVQYIILSHTWEDEEVTFQEFHDLSTASTRKGFAKIKETCRLARSQDYSYAWVDTCCIDKTSSAELSEAINSMFRWYKDAQCCYTYLSDFDRHQVDDTLGECRWFSRGWTLQELIAPTTLTFYNRHWEALGSKGELSQCLTNITGISKDVLLGKCALSSVPVASRMSWAAGRKTSRPEDIAYCLFGIFDVNMPMLYGEGQKAFLRLQEKICQRVADLTLFAWKTERREGNRGIFARHPDEFAHVLNLPLAGFASYTGEMRLTNRGVRFDDIELSIVSGEGLFMSLDFFFWDSEWRRICEGGIFLRNTPEGYVRTKTDILYPLTYLRTKLPPDQINVVAHAASMGNAVTPRLSLGILTEGIVAITDACPRKLWDLYRREFLIEMTREVEVVGLVMLRADLTSDDGCPIALLFWVTDHVVFDFVDKRWDAWPNIVRHAGKPNIDPSFKGTIMKHLNCGKNYDPSVDQGKFSSRHYVGENWFGIRGRVREVKG
ncbi:hypothetical protein FDECE_4208 [Fusarium decemcellulare]|nr:hypothetical protein FDECE_4208 [Fusarium decemcellulare]